MKQASSVVGVFVLAGLSSGLVNVLLGFIHVIVLFLFAGLFLCLGMSLAVSYCQNRKLIPTVSSVRYRVTWILFALGYPLAICFGAMLALVSEGLAMAVMGTRYEVMRNLEPLPMMTFMMIWGSVLAAFIVSAGLMLITEVWDKRCFIGLVVAGLASVGLTMLFYVPVFNSTQPFVTRYREVIFFGVMIPTGDTLFAGLFAVGLLRAMAGMAAPEANSAASRVAGAVQR
jgi:hypothetical protein